MGEPNVDVELRRYLAGVPFSHTRPLSSEERTELKKLLALYGGPPLAFVAWLIVVVANARLESTRFGWGPMVMAICLGLAAVWWIWPYWRLYRQGSVHVYFGEYRDLGAFDGSQTQVSRVSRLRPEPGRGVAILSCGDGEGIWKVNGWRAGLTLVRARSTRAAYVPDQQENGTRRLLPAEVTELRWRIRQHMRPEWLVLGLFCVPGGYFQARSGSGGHFPGLAVLTASAFILSGLALLSKFAHALRFRRSLRRALEAGLVEDGHLVTGLPWVIGGEPALWRTGRPDKWSVSSVDEAIAVQRGSLAADVALERLSSRAPLASTEHDPEKISTGG